jgi:hypothetical protein
VQLVRALGGGWEAGTGIQLGVTGEK